MDRLPVELLDAIFRELDWRDLLSCRAANQSWRGLIDGHDVLVQTPSVATAQGKLAAAYMGLSEATAAEPRHPAWNPRTIIARNEAWMQRDFARALRAARHGHNDLTVEPAYSFDLKSLILEVFGVDTQAHEALEPELHDGHLVISCGSGSEEWSSDGLGFLHVDLNVVDPAVLRRYGKGTRRQDNIIPEGVSWLPWPVSVEAWGISKATHEIVIITAERLDSSDPELPQNGIEIHVLDLKTHRNTQPPSTHILRSSQRTMSTLKIYKNRLLVVLSDQDGFYPMTSDRSSDLIIFDLKPAVRILTRLPLDDVRKKLNSARLSHHCLTGLKIENLAPFLPSSKFDDRELRRSVIELEDAAWLSSELFIVVGTPINHVWIGDQFYCHLDVYSAFEPTSLLVRQPVAVRTSFFPSASSCTLEDLRISAEPDACSPIVVTAGSVRENPVGADSRQSRRRDRIFIDRTELLKVAQEQLALGDTTPIILNGMTRSSCPLYATVSPSTMHTAHRGRHVGFIEGQTLQEEPHNGLHQSAQRQDRGYLLTISQVIPTAIKRSHAPTPQQLHWLGLKKQVDTNPDHDFAILRPLEGWIPRECWDRATQSGTDLNDPRPPQKGCPPIAWQTDFANVPRNNYVTYTRIIDLGDIVSEAHVNGDLAMDDDRIVICETGRREGDMTVHVLPVQGPKLCMQSEEPQHS